MNIFPGHLKMELEKLQKIVANVLAIQPDEVRPEYRFADDLGADSLDMFRIILGIEEAFDVEISGETAKRILTVSDACSLEKTASNG